MRAPLPSLGGIRGYMAIGGSGSEGVPWSFGGASTPVELSRTRPCCIPGYRQAECVPAAFSILDVSTLNLLLTKPKAAQTAVHSPSTDNWIPNFKCVGLSLKR